MAKYNWLKIENEYVTTKKSYRNLCKEFGCSLKALTDQAKKNNWPEKRKQYKNKTITKIEENRETQAEKEANEIIEIQNNQRKRLSLLESAMDGMIIITDENGKEKINPDIDEKKLQSLFSSLKISQDIFFKSYGLTDANINLNLDGSYEDWLKKQIEERGLEDVDYDAPEPDLSIADQVNSIDRLDYDYQENEKPFLEKIKELH
jgi:hypothetical protein